MIRPKGKGMGCLTGIITFYIGLFIACKISDIIISDNVAIPMILCIGAAIGVGWGTEKVIKKNAESNPVTQRIKDIEDNNARLKLERSILNIKYIQGHHQYTQPITANIGLCEDEIMLYTLENISDDGWSVNEIKKIFSIRYSQIVDAAYDTSERITMTRFIMLG